MTYDKTYFPYPSTDTIKKFLIIINQGKKVRFQVGAKSYDHFTEGHWDEARKQRYLKRHKKLEKEDWEDPNNSGYWSAKFLWLYPTYKESYEKIKKPLKNGYITKEQLKKNWKGLMKQEILYKFILGVFVS